MALRISKKPIATEGKWEQFSDAAQFEIVGIDNDFYMAGMARARRLIDRSDAGRSLKDLTVADSDRTEFDIQAELLGRHIVKNWSGADIQDEDGNVIGYTAENAYQLLKSNPSLVVWVIEKATAITVESHESIKESVGKQKRGSGGSSPKPVTNQQQTT